MQAKTKSAGLAGLDSEAVRRWVAEAARTVRQIPPSVIAPSSSQQHLPQHHHQHHHSAHRQHQESSPPSVGTSPFALTTSMTQTPSMHLLENNNLEVAMAQEHQSQLQQHQQQPQKQKQNSPTNNNTIEAWRSIQGGHQWWSPPSNIHQEQVASVVHATSQAPTLPASLCQRQQTSEIDQPLDFSVGSLQQQRLHSRTMAVHERLQGRMQDNNNGTGSGQKIVKSGSRRSYSPSEGSSSGSEDEGVSTGGSPSGPLRGVENGEWWFSFWLGGLVRHMLKLMIISSWSAEIVGKQINNYWGLHPSKHMTCEQKLKLIIVLYLNPPKCEHTICQIVLMMIAWVTQIVIQFEDDIKLEIILLKNGWAKVYSFNQH